MKVCLIGARGHINYVLEGLRERPRVRVVGISDGGTKEANDIGGAVKFCRERGDAAPVFDDYRRMLDETRPDIVSVCGPFEQHAAMCLDGFARGCHVFCEKPVAMTMDELARLRAAHAAAGVHFADMMGIRFEPAFWTARRLVREGAVGAVRLVSTRKSYKLGRRDAYYHRRATSSGIIPWVGSHAVDWIRWFSGEEFLAVYAAHSARNNRDHGELEVSAMCLFRMTNEVSASVSMDYLRPAAAPTHGDDRVRVAGSDGVLEVRGGRIHLVNAAAEGERSPEAACDRTIFGEFIDHVAGTREATLTAADTFAATEACLLARRSADEGRLIAFERQAAQPT